MTGTRTTWPSLWPSHCPSQVQGGAASAALPAELRLHRPGGVGSHGRPGGAGRGVLLVLGKESTRVLRMSLGIHSGGWLVGVIPSFPAENQQVVPGPCELCVGSRRAFIFAATSARLIDTPPVTMFAIGNSNRNESWLNE